MSYCFLPKQNRRLTFHLTNSFLVQNQKQALHSFSLFSERMQYIQGRRMKWSTLTSYKICVCAKTHTHTSTCMKQANTWPNSCMFSCFLVCQCLVCFISIKQNKWQMANGKWRLVERVLFVYIYITYILHTNVYLYLTYIYTTLIHIYIIIYNVMF